MQQWGYNEMKRRSYGEKALWCDCLGGRKTGDENGNTKIYWLFGRGKGCV